MAGEGVQIGVLLDANAPVSVMTDPLLKVVNSRLRELGETPLEATGRGRWTLCLVDGTPLRATQSLTEQDIYDGDRLWIRFLPDTEHRSQVIEHISTAVSANLSKRFAAIDPIVAVQVGASMVAIGVTAAAGLLGWWRWHHNSWLPTVYAAIIAAVVLAVAILLSMRAKTHSGASGRRHHAAERPRAADGGRGFRAAGRRRVPASGVGLRRARNCRGARPALHRSPAGHLHRDSSPSARWRRSRAWRAWSQ